MHETGFYNPEPTGLQLILLSNPGVLMPNVFSRGGVDGVLRDIDSVIAHALETARNKYQARVRRVAVRCRH